MKVRLTKRYAEIINGVDLSRVRAGDVIELSELEASTLIREGWAVSDDPSAMPQERIEAAERPHRSRNRPI